MVTPLEPTDARHRFPRFSQEAMAAIQALIAQLRRVAERKHATRAQIAVAWLLLPKPWIVPIPGTTKLHRLEENLAAAALELADQDLAEIDAALSATPVRGARQSPAGLAFLGR